MPKYARSFDGFDEQILALYAGGMTTRDIQRHLGEIYSVEVSEGLISEVTASIQDDVRAWQGRPQAHWNFEPFVARFHPCGVVVGAFLAGRCAFARDAPPGAAGDVRRRIPGCHGIAIACRDAAYF